MHSVSLESPLFLKKEKKEEKTLPPLPAASSGIIAHTPFTIQKLIKVPNCMDQLRLQESSGVYISKGGAPAAPESITMRAFSPPPARRSAGEFCHRQQFPPQGCGSSAATLYSLIYLIMLMTKVCPVASRRDLVVARG